MAVVIVVVMVRGHFDIDVDVLPSETVIISIISRTFQHWRIHSIFPRENISSIG